MRKMNQIAINAMNRARMMKEAAVDKFKKKEAGVDQIVIILLIIAVAAMCHFVFGPLLKKTIETVSQNSNTLIDNWFKGSEH